MNSSATIEEVAAPAVRAEVLVSLPLGLLGFESIKQYSLVTDPAEAPFQWLQVPDDPTLAFLVLSPFAVVADYELDLSPEDTGFLGLASPADALVLNIVTLRPHGQATINLKGPIVFNRSTLIGKQVILLDGTKNPLQYPLPAAE